MREGLRRLLVVSVLGFVAAGVTLVFGYEFGPKSSTPSTNALATASHAIAVSDSQVCGLLTAAEVQRLLNYPKTTGPAKPQPGFAGGACSWGTGRGESFELTVLAHQPGPVPNPCAGIAGNEVHVGGWVGCSRLEFAPHQVLTAFKGSYTVSIRPETNVIGFRYELDEQTTISHVFRELGA